MNIAVRPERTLPKLARPNLFREAAFVGGVWTGADETITVVNPANGVELGTIPALPAKIVEHAIAAAHQALPAWRARTARERSLILRRWSELVLAHEDDLARLLTTEQGKPLGEALGEVRSTAAFLEWYSEEARRVYGDTIPAARADKRFVVHKVPVGVVAAITPWNFPSSMIARKVAPALAVGCTMVVKPSELTPYSALALAVLAEEAGVPPGVFNVVTGHPAAVGEPLLADQRVRKFSFTGSTAVGKKLAARCMDTVKRVSLELGGNAPFLVFADADLDLAVECAIGAKFRNAGQTCISVNRFLVQDEIYDAFAKKLAARAGAVVVGDGLEAKTEQGPLINDAAVAKVARHVEDAVAKGAKVLTGGKAGTGAGCWFPPTVLSDVSTDAALFREETFGPLAGVLRFKDEAQAIAMANDTNAGLAAYVFTKDVARSHRVTEALEYGMVGLNTPMIANEAAPFGGMKESGLGSEGSFYGLNEYLDIKLVAIDVPAA